MTDKDKVEEILRLYMLARDDDGYMVSKVCEKFYPYKLRNGYLPLCYLGFASNLTRYRRMIQREGKYLPTSECKRRRMQQEFDTKVNMLKLEGEQFCFC